MRTLPFFFAIMFLCSAGPASASLKFTRLDENNFVVTHKTKFGRGIDTAVRNAYRKVASICVAAGFEYFEVQDQEIKSVMFGPRSATVRTEFHRESGEGRIECKNQADAATVEQEKKKLAKMKRR